MAEAAVQPGCPVTFADPQTEAMRQQAIAARETRNIIEDVSKHEAGKHRFAAKAPDTSYQMWRPELAGTFTYEGRAPLRDGGHAVLWTRGTETVIQKETAQVRQYTQHLTPGDTAQLDRDGRARETGQEHGR